jgi:CHAD domain-containing protein
VRRALDRLVTDPPYRSIAHRPGRTALSKQVRKAYGKARRDVATAHGTDQDARHAAVHQVRKAVKRLRYASEVAEPVIGKPAATIRRRCKKIQGVLGDQHDYLALRIVLRELG